MAQSVHIVQQVFDAHLLKRRFENAPQLFGTFRNLQRIGALEFEPPVVNRCERIGGHPIQSLTSYAVQFEAEML